MSRGKTLGDLCSALRGEPRADTDWMETVALSEQALVTPNLAEALEGRDAPDDLRAFLAEVALRNHERNRRLRAMGLEAAAALNAAGIYPTLLKGAALWETCRPGQPFSRLMNDIDFLVLPSEVEQAVQSLQAAGFNGVSRYEGPAVHVVAEFARPNDVGLLDLHQRPPGPPGMAERARGADRVVWDGLARAPSPARQIYLICLHDQLHDGDFWRGGFDLRHLFDIAELSRAMTDADWRELEPLLGTRLAANAIHAELIAAQRLAGAVIPDSITRRLGPRLHYRRHMAQHLHRSWDFVLGVAGFGLELNNILEHSGANRADRKLLLGSSGVDKRHHSPRSARIKKIMSGGTGKV